MTNQQHHQYWCERCEEPLSHPYEYNDKYICFDCYEDLIGEEPLND